MGNWVVAKKCNTHLSIVNSHVHGELPPLSEKLQESRLSEAEDLSVSRRPV